MSIRRLVHSSALCCLREGLPFQAFVEAFRRADLVAISQVDGRL